MAFAATALQNFEFLKKTSSCEVMWLPGDPGVTFTRGEMCSLSNGVLIRGTDSAANAVFRVDKTTVCPAASQAFPKSADMIEHRDSAANKTLVQVQAMIPDGSPVYLANIKNWTDDTVVSYTASTRAIAETTGHGADNRPNGALLYVYTGVGSGELNVVEDYDNADGAAELLLICHRAFNATIDTTTSYIVLSPTTAANAVTLFGRGDLADEDEFDVADGSDDGDYVVYCDWRLLQHYLALGQVPVINRMHLFS